VFAAAEWITVGVLGVSTVVWLVRLEGRVNSHDQAIATVNEKLDRNDRLLREDVAYIRSRIDQAVSR
jgi:hypothetical protein